jgi:hypothetical protein
MEAAPMETALDQCDGLAAVASRAPTRSPTTASEVERRDETRIGNLRNTTGLSERLAPARDRA